MLDKNRIDRIVEMLENIQEVLVGAWGAMIFVAIVAWYIRSM